MYSKLISDMHAHSIEQYPKEACGIITKDFKYIKTKNISNTPKISFIIDPIEILKNEDNIWGFYHSHPGSADPIPSKADLASTVFTEYKFLVGFANNTYIYWLNKDQLCFERFNESHCTLL